MPKAKRVQTMNQFMTMMIAARREEQPSFQYKGKTYTRCPQRPSVYKAGSLETAPQPDPVQQKIDMVCAALADASYEVPGSQNCREMMMAIAPVVLKAFKGERNSNQDAALGMLGEIFASEEARRQGFMAEEKSKVDEADKQWNMFEAAKDTVEAELQGKTQEVADKKEVLAADIAFVADTEKEMHDAENAKGSAEAEHEILRKEKEMCCEVQRGSFVVLKEGSTENAREQQRHIGILTQLFKKLAVDKSMWAALPTAMGKKPADRGSFDILVVQQLGDSLTRHIASLGEKLENAAMLSTQKSAAACGSRVVVEVIREKQQASAQALKAAQAEQKQLEARLAECWQALTEHEATTLQETNSSLWKSTSHLERAQAVKGALAFLLERDAMPEPTVSEEAEEETEPTTKELSTEELAAAEPIATELITETSMMQEPPSAMNIKVMTEVGSSEHLLAKVMQDEQPTADLRIGGM